MTIELHYSTGGHGGPYADLDTALERARLLLKGNLHEMFIQARQGVNGPLLATIAKAAETAKVDYVVHRF